MVSLTRDVGVAEGETLLQATDLTVRFSGLTALDSVNLLHPARRDLGLIGPNGARKTTCFNAITGGVPTDLGNRGLRRSAHRPDETPPDHPARHRRTFQNIRLWGAR